MASRVAARDLEEMRAFIDNNPHEDITMLILAKANWLRGVKTIGLCLLRRTWSNNICIPYVAARPGAAGDGGKPIRGIGAGLVYCVTYVASEIGAGAVWGEVTQNSKRFWERITGRAVSEDLVYLSKSEYLAIKTAMEGKVGHRKEPS